MAPRVLRLCAAIGIAVAPLVVGQARATTVLAQSLGSLTRASGLIVRGHVEDVVGHAEVGGHPFRLARVRILERVEGPSADVAWVRLPGGLDAHGRAWNVAGVPDLAVGDEVVLFLEPVPPDLARRATVRPAGEFVGPHGGHARPADAAPPVAQWMPIALAAGTYHVDRRGPVPLVDVDAAAAGLRRVGEVAPDAPAPDRARLDELLGAVRARVPTRGTP